MTIAIDGRMLNWSGVGTYVRNLLPRVIQLGNKFEFRVLIRQIERGTPSSCYGPNATRIVSGAPFFSLSEQIDLLAKSRGTALFWSPHFLIPLLYGGKLLVTVQDVYHLAVRQGILGAHKKLFAKVFFNTIRRNADGVICTSRFTADELIRLTGIRANKITVIACGVDDTWFNSLNGGRPHPKPYLLFVGNVKPHKNLVRLVTAFGAIVDSIPHDLVIVGRKEGFITHDRVVERVAAKLGDRIMFTGFVEDTRLRQYLKHADAFVFPSLYEGFGLPPLEAMASGCPVIASRVASLPEVCGDAALYCDPYDTGDISRKMLYLLSSQDLRMELREKGVLHAHRFSWEQ